MNAGHPVLLKVMDAGRIQLVQTVCETLENPFVTMISSW